ncbi:nucleotide-binding domain-containing protein [Mesorhizobium japonicum]
MTHQETTRYAGSHSIECFIVKDGLLAARSGQFIVNIV